MFLEIRMKPKGNDPKIITLRINKNQNKGENDISCEKIKRNSEKKSKSPLKKKLGKIIINMKKEADDDLSYDLKIINGKNNKKQPLKVTYNQKNKEKMNDIQNKNEFDLDASKEDSHKLGDGKIKKKQNLISKRENFKFQELNERKMIESKPKIKKQSEKFKRVMMLPKETQAHPLFSELNNNPGKMPIFGRTTGESQPAPVYTDC